MCVGEWPRQRQQLLQRLRTGALPFSKPLSTAGGGGNHIDIASGQHMLGRFSSLRQAVVSVQLGMLAWEAAGYEHLAQALLQVPEPMPTATTHVPASGPYSTSRSSFFVWREREGRANVTTGRSSENNVTI